MQDYSIQKIVRELNNFVRILLILYVIFKTRAGKSASKKSILRKEGSFEKNVLTHSYTNKITKNGFDFFKQSPWALCNFKIIQSFQNLNNIAYREIIWCIYICSILNLYFVKLVMFFKLIVYTIIILWQRINTLI